MILNAWSDAARAAALEARRSSQHAVNLSKSASTYQDHIAARDAHNDAADKYTRILGSGNLHENHQVSGVGNVVTSRGEPSNEDRSKAAAIIDAHHAASEAHHSMAFGAGMDSKFDTSSRKSSLQSSIHEHSKNVGRLIRNTSLPSFYA